MFCMIPISPVVLSLTDFKQIPLDFSDTSCKFIDDNMEKYLIWESTAVINLSFELETIPLSSQNEH